MHWIDPTSLPEVAGTVERFVLNPHGEVDGFVMKDRQQTEILVHTPPHLEAELTGHVKPNDQVTVRGVRPRGVPLLAAIALTTANGHQIIDRGPDHDRRPPHVERKRMDAKGTVRLSLFGPKGELRGALLRDGTVVRLGPKEAEALRERLETGATLAVRGEGVETRYGRVIQAKEIGAAMEDLRAIKADKADKPKPKPKHAPEAHA